LTILEKDKIESTTLDLYFRAEQDVEFYMKGKGECHLNGYYEPAEMEESEEEDIL